MTSEFSRIVTALETTLDQLKSGPSNKEDREPYSAFIQRVQAWERDKRRFAAFAITCLKSYDLDLAIHYVRELRRIKELT